MKAPPCKPGNAAFKSTQSPAKEFKDFAYLPGDIRKKIWLQALHGRRVPGVVTIEYSESLTLFEDLHELFGNLDAIADGRSPTQPLFTHGGTKMLSVTMACKEAYEVIMSEYIIIHPDFLDRALTFNPRSDIIHFPAMSILHNVLKHTGVDSWANFGIQNIAIDSSAVKSMNLLRVAYPDDKPAEIGKLARVSHHNELSMLVQSAKALRYLSPDLKKIIILGKQNDLRSSFMVNFQKALDMSITQVTALQESNKECGPFTKWKLPGIYDKCDIVEPQNTTAKVLSAPSSKEELTAYDTVYSNYPFRKESNGGFCGLSSYVWPGWNSVVKDTVLNNSFQFTWSNAAKTLQDGSINVNQTAFSSPPQAQYSPYPVGNAHTNVSTNSVSTVTLSPITPPVAVKRVVNNLMPPPSAPSTPRTQSQASNGSFSTASATPEPVVLVNNTGFSSIPSSVVSAPQLGSGNGLNAASLATLKNSSLTFPPLESAQPNRPLPSGTSQSYRHSPYASPSVSQQHVVGTPSPVLTQTSFSSSGSSSNYSSQFFSSQQTCPPSTPATSFTSDMTVASGAFDFITMGENQMVALGLTDLIGAINSAPATPGRKPAKRGRKASSTASVPSTPKRARTSGDQVDSPGTPTPAVKKANRRRPATKMGAASLQGGKDALNSPIGQQFLQRQAEEAATKQIIQSTPLQNAEEFVDDENMTMSQIMSRFAVAPPNQNMQPTQPQFGGPVVDASNFNGQQAVSNNYPVYNMTPSPMMNGTYFINACGQNMAPSPMLNGYSTGNAAVPNMVPQPMLNTIQNDQSRLDHMTMINEAEASLGIQYNQHGNHTTQQGYPEDAVNKFYGGQKQQPAIPQNFNAAAIDPALGAAQPAMIQESAKAPEAPVQTELTDIPSMNFNPSLTLDNSELDQILSLDTPTPQQTQSATSDFYPSQDGWNNDIGFGTDESTVAQNELMDTMFDFDAASYDPASYNQYAEDNSIYEALGMASPYQSIPSSPRSP